MRGPANQHLREAFERGGTHARHPPSANMTCSDAAFKIFPDEKQRGGGTIFALDTSGLQDSKYKIPSPHFRILKQI